MYSVGSLTVLGLFCFQKGKTTNITLIYLRISCLSFIFMDLFSGDNNGKLFYV